MTELDEVAEAIYQAHPNWHVAGRENVEYLVRQQMSPDESETIIDGVTDSLLALYLRASS